MQRYAVMELLCCYKNCRIDVDDSSAQSERVSVFDARLLYKSSRVFRNTFTQSFFLEETLDHGLLSPGGGSICRRCLLLYVLFSSHCMLDST